MSKKKLNLCISVTYHKNVDVEVEGDYDYVTLNRLARNKVYKIHKFMDDNEWTEDEFEAIIDDYDN